MRRECDRLTLFSHQLPNLLHLGALLQCALILYNERSLKGEATAEITDPL